MSQLLNMVKGRVAPYVVPDWHRKIVGGLWEELGRKQLDFLLEHGLEPEHRLLDVGCGSLRGGVHFIEYLDGGNYYGVDADPRILRGAEKELDRYDLRDQRPTLRLSDDFDVDFGVSFDVAFAQSLFTHLPVNQIELCLRKVDAVLEYGGRFFATFFLNPHGRAHLEPIVQTEGGLTTYPARNPFHYTPEAFEWAIEGTELELEVIGLWDHPRNQQMLRFTKVGSDI